jgi:septal ring factor EnvC (AmiA/AmiB activator)
VTCISCEAGKPMMCLACVEEELKARDDEMAKLKTALAKLKTALAKLNGRDVKRAQLAKERAAAANNEHPERPERPRCTAKTRRGLPCMSFLGTQYAGLCRQHAATAWDRYVKQQRPAAPEAA